MANVAQMALIAFIYQGPQFLGARWPILMCGAGHGGPSSCGSVA